MNIAWHSIRCLSTQSNSRIKFAGIFATLSSQEYSPLLVRRNIRHSSPYVRRYFIFHMQMSHGEETGEQSANIRRNIRAGQCGEYSSEYSRTTSPWLHRASFACEKWITGEQSVKSIRMYVYIRRYFAYCSPHVHISLHLDPFLSVRARHYLSAPPSHLKRQQTKYILKIENIYKKEHNRT